MNNSCRFNSVEKTNIYFVAIIGFMYINRGLVGKFGLNNLPTLLTLVSIVFNIIFIVRIKLKKEFLPIYYYLILGILYMVLSFYKTEILQSIIGFSAFFLNLIFWLLTFNNIRRDNIIEIIDLFIRTSIILALISSILGIYQYFFDASIFGFATHSIYGSNELLNSGRYVRRATALLGSPQNYSLYLGITSYFVFLKLSKSNFYKVAFVILLIGGILSGSRTYTLMVFMCIGLHVLIQSINRIKVSIVIIVLFCIIIIFIGLIFFSDNISDNLTMSRLFTFFKSWPALEIIVSSIKDIDYVEFLFGNGLGYRERLVAQFLSIQYESVESFIISLFLQTGLLFLIFFMYIYITSISKYIKSKTYSGSILLITLITNLLVTPTFNGLAMSFIVWPIIIYSYSKEYIFRNLGVSNGSNNIL